MLFLKILAPPYKRFYSDLHPFFKWRKQLLDLGIDVEVLYDHKKVNDKKTDCLIINHMYFHAMWNNKLLSAEANEAEWIVYLQQIKQSVGKLIWWDAQDTSCSTGFGVIPYVDIFLKNQILKDSEYYIGSPDEQKNLRVWIDPNIEQKKFVPCPPEQKHKIRVGWNLGFNDYRYFPFKLHYYLSNYTPYNIYDVNFTDVNAVRNIDLTFRGKLDYDNQYPQHNAISFQRNFVINLMDKLPLKSAYGPVVKKKQYWNELRNSKVCLSPFGFGEVCYRDFESFISGALLLKPSMDHLVTYPNLFIPDETYIPLSWDLSDVEEKLEDVIANYDSYKHIAENGQELYKKVLNDPNVFIGNLERILR